jgi:inositol-phosphate phosphatase/L-galactose 1-phosphate phosphatase/histidinol-phosphatase
MPAMTTVTAAQRELATALADQAGAIVRRYFRKPLAIEQKADLSPVTQADREAEQAMRGMIESAFPDHGIFGEEFGRVRAESDFTWVLDPIDGTKSFIAGLPLFGILIALCFKGKPVLGIIDQPVSRERWVGIAGEATIFNGKAVHTRTGTGLAEATLYATSPDMFEGEAAAGFGRLRNAVKLTRYGADCYAYGLLACGFIDLVVESALKPYDFSALAPVVEGAGGSFTDWQGAPVSLASDGRVIAAGDARLGAAAQAVLAKR